MLLSKEDEDQITEPRHPVSGTGHNSSIQTPEQGNARPTGGLEQSKGKRHVSSVLDMLTDSKKRQKKDHAGPPDPATSQARQLIGAPSSGNHKDSPHGQRPGFTEASSPLEGYPLRCPFCRAISWRKSKPFFRITPPKRAMDRHPIYARFSCKSCPPPPKGRSKYRQICVANASCGFCLREIFRCRCSLDPVDKYGKNILLTQNLS